MEKTEDNGMWNNGKWYWNSSLLAQQNPEYTAFGKIARWHYHGITFYEKRF